MNLNQILCKPFQWTQKLHPCLAQEEYPYLCSYFHGRIVEIFCRGGRWGQHLVSNGHAWSGMDVDAQALEGALLRGLFSVSVGVFPAPKSCDMIFSPLAPLSMVSPETYDAFVRGVHEALSPQGTVLLSLWEEPDVRTNVPLMYTHNGEEKLVMACSVGVVGNIATLDMEWMVATDNQKPRSMHHKEERYLHSVGDTHRHFFRYFAHVEIVTLVGRRWLFAKKA